MGVVPNTNGSVTVTFNLSDSGGSGIARARIVAVREENNTTPRNQNTGVLSATTSEQAVVVSSDLSTSSGTNMTYTFSAGQLEYYAKYFFYLACQDTQGWYNTPPGSETQANTPGNVTGVAIGGNGGRVYDPTPPTIIVTDVRADDDGTLRVTYNLTESGNSQLNGARVVASTTAMTRAQVLAATGTSSADVSVAGATVNLHNQVVVLSGLSNWSSYRVYYAALDNQLWYDNGSTTGGNAPSRAIDSNGGRSWDTVSPTISITNMAFTNPGTSNTLRVTVAITDMGSSGIERATIFLRESGGTNNSISQETILFGTGSGQRQNVLTNTTSNYNNSIMYDFTNLTEYTQYHAYVAVRDNQGNYNGSAASANASYNPVTNPLSVTGQAIPNGGRTYDLTAPTVSVSSQSVMASSVQLQVSASDNVAVSRRHVGVFADNYTPTNEAAFTGTNGSRVAVQTNATNATWYTFTGLSQATSYDAFAFAIDSSNNIAISARLDFTTLDSTAPTVSVSSQSVMASSVQLQVSASDNVAVSRRHVGVFVNNYTPTNEAAFTGTNGSRVAVQTNASNATWYTFTGLSQATSYDAFAFAIDSSNNIAISARLDFTTLSAPVFVSATITGGTEQVVFQYRVTDADGNLQKVEFYRNNTLVGTHTTANFNSTSDSGVKTFTETGVSAGTYNNCYMKVYDTTSYTAQSTTVNGVSVASANSVPQIVTFSVSSPSGGTLRFTWNVTDANSNLASIAFFYGTGNPLTQVTDTISGGSSSGTKNFTVAAGTYSGYIVVSDSASSTATSSTVTGVVVAAANAAPVFITGQFVDRGGGYVGFNYRVTDANGNLKEVRFFLNNVKVGTHTPANFTNKDVNTNKSDSGSTLTEFTYGPVTGTQTGKMEAEDEMGLVSTRTFDPLDPNRLRIPNPGVVIPSPLSNMPAWINQYFIADSIETSNTNWSVDATTKFATVTHSAGFWNTAFYHDIKNIPYTTRRCGISVDFRTSNASLIQGATVNFTILVYDHSYYRWGVLEIVYHLSAAYLGMRISYKGDTHPTSSVVHWVTDEGMIITETTHRYTISIDKETKIGTFSMVNPTTGVIVHSGTLQNILIHPTNRVQLGIFGVCHSSTTFYWGNIEILT
jgi:hypothetical protein